MKIETSNSRMLRNLINTPINSIQNSGYRAEVIFFKESGKYYTSEEIVISEFDNKPIYHVFDAIVEYYKDSYKGMTMVVNFQYDFPNAYPFMKPGSERI